MLEPIGIFPAYGLDNSLLTAVLIGLYIRFFFNEWLGWVFSGLVVPGYLAAIILLRPASAVMIIAEAVVTLILVRGLSQILAQTKRGTPMFGRDRFVWLCVVSVGVRAVFEVLLGPFVEAKLRSHYGWDPQDSFGLFGIGLVLVPLCANACWKPGLLRGSFQQIVCTGVTYLILRALLATTNLSFAGVAETFDQVALQFRASPKAYLLLLGGVLFASRANLRFGWDTSGVLIPGLICLGFFAPIKVLATVVEALLIASGAALFLRLPRVRDWNVEGPRRVVLLFTIGYFIKFVVIGVLGLALPSFTATEFFGIGYLLPSLLAMKIWQRRNPAMVLLPALSLAAAGFGIGSLVGYELVVASAALQSRGVIGSTSDPDGRDAGSCVAPTALVSELRRAPARVARTLAGQAAPRISGRELDSLSLMLRRLRVLTAQGAKTCAPLLAQLRPGTLGLRLQAASSPAGRQFFTLHESAEEAAQLRGFGLFAVAAEPHGGPTLVVENPSEDLSDPGALASLVELLRADAVVIGGLAQPELGRGDVRRDADVALRAATRALAGPVVTIRTGALAQPELRGFVPDAAVAALATKLGPLSRKAGDSGHTGAELALSGAAEQALAAPLRPQIRQFATTADWLLAQLSTPLPTVAPRRSPTAELLLADAVIRPLARAQASDTTAALAERIAGAAGELGFAVAQIAGTRPRLGLYGHGESLLLTPSAPGAALIEVLSRRRGVAELAAALFDSREGRALLISVSLPAATEPGLLGRVAAPILALTPPQPEVIVVRAGLTPTPDCSIVSDSVPTAAAAATLPQLLLDTLQTMGIRCELRAQYDRDTQEPPGHLFPLLRLRSRPDFVTLRVGPELRERFRAEPLTGAQQLLFARLGVPTVQLSLQEALAGTCSADAAAPAAAIAPALVADARSFAATRHPALIERLAAGAQAEHLSFRIIDDTRQGSAYLLLAGPGRAAAITLRPQETAAATLRCGGELAEQLRQAQAQGAAVIEVRAP